MRCRRPLRLRRAMASATSANSRRSSGVARSGRQARHQALQLAPYLEQPQLRLKLISETMMPRWA